MIKIVYSLVKDGRAIDVNQTILHKNHKGTL